MDNIPNGFHLVLSDGIGDAIKEIYHFADKYYQHSIRMNIPLYAWVFSLDGIIYRGMSLSRERAIYELVCDDDRFTDVFCVTVDDIKGLFPQYNNLTRHQQYNKIKDDIKLGSERLCTTLDSPPLFCNYINIKDVIIPNKNYVVLLPFGYRSMGLVSDDFYYELIRNLFDMGFVPVITGDRQFHNNDNGYWDWIDKIKKEIEVIDLTLSPSIIKSWSYAKNAVACITDRTMGTALFSLACPKLVVLDKLGDFNHPADDYIFNDPKLLYVMEEFVNETELMEIIIQFIKN
tara:strand:- start:509 stop:1375 length:867 start_codon:yes stop_codon:yes gene_type:complete